MECYRINGAAVRWLQVYYRYGHSLHQTSSTPVLGWEEHVCVVVCVCLTFVDLCWCLVHVR